MSDLVYFEVLPAAEVIEVHDVETVTLVELAGDRFEIVQAGSIVINSSGGAAQEHVQGTPAATWIIAHSFGRKPAVTVHLASGEEVGTDVVATTTTVTITFPTATAGSAILH